MDEQAVLEAKALLYEVLAGGELPYEVVAEVAFGRGISPRVLFAARARVGVVMTRRGSKGWCWRLPSGDR